MPAPVHTTLSRTHVSKRQWRKLRPLLLDAAANVPFYRDRFAAAGIAASDLRDPSVLRHLPIVTKDDLLSVAESQRRNGRFPSARLSSESTTGSTGQPFTIWQEPAYVRRRNLRFMAAMVACGYRPWRRLMLLTDRHTGTVRKAGNRFYVSVEQPTAAIHDAYLRIRPDLLYGFATPLRLLAEQLARRREAHRPRGVISTAEMLDAGTRSMLRATFGCAVGDFYGMTEMGLVSWQRPGDDHYIMSPNAVLTEYHRTGESGRYRMIMTNLDLHASPMIRFDTGDLLLVEDTDTHPVVRGFEGRAIDTIVTRDGAEFSPYRVTDALRDLPGLRRFKVTQQAIDEFDVAAEIEGAPDVIGGRIRRALEDLLGPGLRINVLTKDRVIAESDRKFRPVESRVARS